MKKIFAVLALTIMATQVFGAVIKSAIIDESKENILISVVYGGGCGSHDFSLQLGNCLEIFPVKCDAKLIEKTNDHCEAIISSTIVISLAQYSLDESYFQNGSLTITGDQDWQTGKLSQATVTLPSLK